MLFRAVSQCTLLVAVKIDEKKKINIAYLFDVEPVVPLDSVLLELVFHLTGPVVPVES